MSVVVTFTTPAATFTLGRTLGGDPATRIRMSRIIPTGDSFIPYFWATVDSVSSITRRLRSEPDIESFEVVERTDAEALIRVDWAKDVDGMLAMLAEAEASLLVAEGAGETWTFKVRFDDHPALSAFFERCSAQDIEIDLQTVNGRGDRQPRAPATDLTVPQREALTLALESGYFDVPRRTTLVDLAEELGVTDSAVSQRIRRGVETILSRVIQPPEEPPPRQG